MRKKEKFSPEQGGWRQGLRHVLTRVWPKHIPIALKLAFVITLLVVAGMSTLGLFILANQNRVMQEQLNDFGDTVATHLAQLAAEPVLSEDSLRLRLLTANLVQDQQVLGAAIYAHNGRLLSSAGLLPPQSPISADGVNPAQQWVWLNPEQLSERLVSFAASAVYQDVQVGYSTVTLSASLMDAAGKKAGRAIIFATIFMSLLASMLAYWMSKRLSQPIQNLMEATRAIDRGDLDVRISDRRNDEIGFLIDGFNSMAEGLLRKSQVEQVFSRYVSKNVASKVLANLDEVRLGSQHVNATVLFADIVGFTAMAETLQPVQVSSLLNEYFSYISTACRLYGGVVDKFIGDCAMLVFGAVEDDDNQSLNAVCCAVLIQKLVRHLNERRRQDGEPEVHFRIGINCGSMLAGNLGSDERMEYTVVGDAVNLASRLCYAARSGQIIVREDLFKQLHSGGCIRATAQGSLSIRGKSRPVTVYNITGVHEKYHPRLNASLEEVLSSRETASV